ncbi:YoaK family protein, partial [Amycolatopsis samaneae]
MTGGRLTAGTLRLAAVLAVAGGFLDAFTFVAHDGVFANAQTGNVVLLGVFAARGEWGEALGHVPPLLAFVAGVAVAETVTHPRVAPWLRRPLRVALCAEIAVLAVIGFLPDSFSSTAIVLTVSFVAALQNSTFGKLGDWAVNTTMTTGNLRTATRAAYRAVFR